MPELFKRAFKHMFKPFPGRCNYVRKGLACSEVQVRREVFKRVFKHAFKHFLHATFAKA